MTASNRIDGAARLRAAWYMGRVSLVRLLFSRQTLVCGFLLAMAVVATTFWSMRRQRSMQQFIDQVSPVYVSFLLPAFCLSYATACVAADREEKTLLYSLMTPVPRPLVYTVRLSAALLLALAWTVGGLALLCRTSGGRVWSDFGVLWPASVWSTVAYVCLFGLFSVLFQRATILSLVYVVFLEQLWGSVPGMAKRVAVSFHTRCMMLDDSQRFGLRPPRRMDLDIFMPISGSAAMTTLFFVSLACLFLGAWLFSRREFA